MATIGPGVYSQISVSGNSQLTMTAGTYIIQTGGFTASGNAVITLGAGSSIILEGGGLSVSGNAAIRGRERRSSTSAPTTTPVMELTAATSAPSRSAAMAPSA